MEKWNNIKKQDLTPFATPFRLDPFCLLLGDEVNILLTYPKNSAGVPS